MPTMALEEAREYIDRLITTNGNIPIVLYDLDTGYYFSLAQDNFELQRLEDGSIRVSLGVNSFEDTREPEPAIRPIKEVAQ